MEHWIEHVSEPDRLLLAWQAADKHGDRQRFAVGELLRRGDDACLRYFDPAEFESFNGGQPFSKIVDYGFKGHPAFPIEKLVHERGVLPILMRRLPPKNRADFGEYKQHLRLRPDAPISDFALLGLSEAHLPSDGFSVVDPLKPDVDQCELVIEVAGYRYYAEKVARPTALDPVELRHETDNRFDPNAVAVMVRGQKIGNVNRLQAPTFREWIADGRIAAEVHRMNGTPDRPRVFVFVKVGKAVA